LSSGSEAVEFGVQSARRITGRPLLLTLSDSYLAAYGSAGNKSSAEWLAFDWGVCVGCSRAERCDPRCEHLGEIPFEKMGGLVFEPGNSGGSVRLPPPGLVRILESEIKKQQGLIVVDEVTTGLGRTGTWCGYHHYRMRPDVVALGKGLGNGYPVSAVVMTEEAAGQLENRGFHYAQSHQNDPLGCAVAREVIRILREERLVERSRRVGADFLANLKELAKRHDSLREARGRGLMIVLEFEKAGGTSRLLEVYRALLERGHLAGCKPAAELLRFYPPLTIAEDDIDRLLGDLDRILRSLT